MRKTWDPEKKWLTLKKMTEEERKKWRFDFGEAIGMLALKEWYPAITHGHEGYATTYNFPIRIKFIENFEAPKDKVEEWGTFINIPEFVKSAKELEEEGVRAIVTDCGLTGAIQKELSNSVNIPVFTSSLLLVPLISKTLKDGQKVGILTASSRILTAQNKRILKNCGIDESIPIVIAGMSESDYAETWWSQLDLDFDRKKVEEAIVSVAKKMVSENPDIGAIVCECTEMPPYSEAVRRATSLPVFDSVDVVRFVHGAVK